MLAAVLAPGYGGSSEQSIIKAMASRLAAIGITLRPISYSRARPSADLVSEIEDVRRAQRIAAANPPIELHVLRGVGHQFGPRQAEGLERAATWLLDRLNA